MKENVLRNFIEFIIFPDNISFPKCKVVIVTEVKVQ